MLHVFELWILSTGDEVYGLMLYWVMRQSVATSYLVRYLVSDYDGSGGDIDTGCLGLWHEDVVYRDGAIWVLWTMAY